LKKSSPPQSPRIITAVGVSGKRESQNDIKKNWYKDSLWRKKGSKGLKVKAK